jgi:hypothetical protein
LRANISKRRPSTADFQRLEPTAIQLFQSLEVYDLIVDAVPDGSRTASIIKSKDLTASHVLDRMAAPIHRVSMKNGPMIPEYAANVPRFGQMCGPFTPMRAPFKLNRGRFKPNRGPFTAMGAAFKPMIRRFTLKGGPFTPMDAPFKLNRGRFKPDRAPFRRMPGPIAPISHWTVALVRVSGRRREGGFRRAFIFFLLTASGFAPVPSGAMSDGDWTGFRC